MGEALRAVLAATTAAWLGRLGYICCLYCTKSRRGMLNGVGANPSGRWNAAARAKKEEGWRRTGASEGGRDAMVAVLLQPTPLSVAASKPT